MMNTSGQPVGTSDTRAGNRPGGAPSDAARASRALLAALGVSTAVGLATLVLVQFAIFPLLRAWIASSGGEWVATAIREHPGRATAAILGAAALGTLPVGLSFWITWRVLNRRPGHGARAGDGVRPDSPEASSRDS